MDISNTLKDIIDMINSVPRIIMFPLSVVIFLYSMFKFGAITDRASYRASTSEKNLRYSYKNAVNRLATGNFDKIVTREHCEKIVELYKDGIPKQNKLKNFLLFIRDAILMTISIVFMIAAFIIMKS